MSEQFQTRTEHSRSMEDAEKFRALHTLRELGVLIPLSELETYHGRVGETDKPDQWTVDPNFSNGGNNTGNLNLNQRPALYTANSDIAKEFAEHRIRQEDGGAYYQYFLNKVDSYTPEEKQEWLDRSNRERELRLQEKIKQDPEFVSTEYYNRLLDQHGKLIPLEFGDLRRHSEAEYLEQRLSPEQRDYLLRQVVPGSQVELHQITSPDTEATVMDFTFNPSKLDPEAKTQYLEAMKSLLIPVAEGSPLDFEDRDKALPISTAMQKLPQKGYFNAEDITSIASMANVEESVVLQLAGSVNARSLLSRYPIYFINQLLEHQDGIVTAELKINDQEQLVPINMEYIQRFLREAHIVGARQHIKSGTLGRSFSIVTFFDLEKTTTTEDLKASRKERWRLLGNMAISIGVLGEKPRENHLLISLLDDLHVKPERLVEAARTLEGYGEIFGSETGNWEGFTLAEHTETVLRNFDENFADKLPVELLKPLRLAILAHDLGKPAASARNEKHLQKKYNVNQADAFFDKLGVDTGLKELLLAVIGDGEELAFQINVAGADEYAEKAMRELAISTLQKFYGLEQITDEQINAFMEMCRILQICDGGAYTSMAVTRREGKGRHRNAPSFNHSFANPAGFGKRTLQLKGEDDRPAALNQTPMAAS